jgi:DNA-binding SARP family transcriptional activator
MPATRKSIPVERLLELREDARRLQVKILGLLIERLGASPEEALPYARQLVAVDSFDETAWAQLITTLASSGRQGEASQQYEAGLRALREVGGGGGPLLRAWRSVQAAASRPAPREATISAAPTRAPRASIVVLPFANLSDSTEQGYLADGITEDLTTELANVPGLFVVSRNAAFSYKGKVVPPAQINKELGAVKQTQ